jgi:hypothetical protein
MTFGDAAVEFLASLGAAALWLLGAILRVVLAVLPLVLVVVVVVLVLKAMGVIA